MQDPVHAEYLRRAMRQRSRSQKLWMFPVGLGIWVYAMLTPVVGDLSLGGDLPAPGAAGMVGEAGLTDRAEARRGARKDATVRMGCEKLAEPVTDKGSEAAEELQSRAPEDQVDVARTDIVNASMPRAHACMGGCA